MSDQINPLDSRPGSAVAHQPGPDAELHQHAGVVGRASMGATQILTQEALRGRGHAVNQNVVDQASTALDALFRLSQSEPRLLVVFRNISEPLFELNRQGWRVALTNEGTGSSVHFVCQPPATNL